MRSLGVAHPMTPRASRCLERCLSALDDRTSAPLCLLGHSTSPLHEVFEVTEITEGGRAAEARRFLVSVHRDLSAALLVPLSPLGHPA